MMKIKNLQNASNKEIVLLQNKSYEILCYFKNFCEAHGLKFFLAGGTLIGAVRHAGFIPWDDDIDVFMLRDDYEKLAILWGKYADVNRYSYCRTNNKENYHNTGASIRDNNTTFINRHSVNDDINHGLQIDILPLDYVPSNKLECILQRFWAMIFSLYNAQRLPDRQGNIVRILSDVLLKVIPNKKIRFFIWNEAEQRMCKYKKEDSQGIVELTSGLKAMKRIFSFEIFDSVIYKKFVNEEMPIMTGYDEYLKKVWGDYMRLPPLSEQVAKHNTVFIDLDNSYKKYKGIYYCVKTNI